MSFEEYVRLRGPALVRLARLLTGDRHRGEDLAQDVLSRAYPRWKRIARTERPDLYLRKMLVNANASWWRRFSSRELVISEHPDQPDNSDIGAKVVERDALWRQITALPPRQRAVVVLRYYEDLDDATIAEIMDCSAVTVRTHAMRALATLRTSSGLQPGVRSEAPTTSRSTS